MYLGSIVEVSDTEALYEKPRHPYTKALFSAVPKAEPDSDWLKERLQLTGEIPDSGHVPPGCNFAPRCPYASERCRQAAPPLTEQEQGHFVACWETQA